MLSRDFLLKDRHLRRTFHTGSDLWFDASEMYALKFFLFTLLVLSAALGKHFDAFKLSIRINFSLTAQDADFEDERILEDMEERALQEDDFEDER